MFYGFGVQELLIVFIIALVLFGGKKLPEVGKNLGKALRSFKQAEEETRRGLEDAVKEPAPPEEKPGKTDQDEEKASNGDLKTGSDEDASTGGDATGEEKT